MQIVTKFKKFLLVTLLMASVVSLKGQTTDALGTYTPYSLFGLGEISKQGTALNLGMGGIGVGIRDNRFINYVNPAAITARDTLAFMLDFGMNQKNFYNSDGKIKSAYNTANMQNIIFTAPIYKKSAFIVGITPYSNIGYKFESTENDPSLVANYGDIKYQQYGEGSINQLFVGTAMNFFKNFSVGAEFIYYFGALNRYSNVVFGSDETIRPITTGWDYSIDAISARFGMQYFAKLPKNTILTVGATYRLKSKLKGDLTRFAYAGVDTIKHQEISNAHIYVPSEFGLGVSIKRNNKWLVGFDYSRQNWGKESLSDIAGSGSFQTISSNTYKLGFEIIPNRYDIRYYMKRVTYRAGLYYEQSYMKVNGKQINSAGFTFGMSLPIYRWYNAVNWAVDFGQRGSLKNENVRERYVQFLINISLHDIWFKKHKYD